MFCGKCGKETTEGNLYCIYCGNKLENNNIENKSDSEPTMGAYQKFIKDNFSNDGTKTYMKDIMSPVKENKTDMPANEEIQLKKDTVNITTETSTNNTKIKEPPTAWLKFLSIVWFIGGIIGVIIYPIYVLAFYLDSDILSNFTIILQFIVGFTLSILCIVAYDCIDKHKESGYYLFLIIIYSPILWQIISIISAAFLPNIDYISLFVTFMTYLIFDGIWISCNYIYISKRKESYFNIKD